MCEYPGHCGWYSSLDEGPELSKSGEIKLGVSKKAYEHICIPVILLLSLDMI